MLIIVACCWLLRPCDGIQPQLDSPETRRRVRTGYALATNPVVPVLGDCCNKRRGVGGRAAAHDYCRRSVAAPDSLQTVDAVFCSGFTESSALVESGYQRASRGVALGGLFKSLASIGCQRVAANQAMQRTRDKIRQRG